MNYSAKKTIELLKAYNVSDEEIENLLNAARCVMKYRNASQVAFRHLIIAAGIKWGSRDTEKHEVAA